MILGNGRFGASLSKADKKNTYYSNDFGDTWKKILPYPTIYEFADFGGLILFGKTDLAASNLAFTWTEGATMTECNLGGALAQGVEVVDILARPGGDTLQFLVLGRLNETSEVLLHVNFAGMDLRACDPADYELWNTGCLDGVVTTYLRRVAGSQCINAKPSFVSSSQCPCTEEDWECDICFVRSASNKCIHSSNCTRPGPRCAPGSFYTESSGYRLITGDRCDTQASNAVTHWPTTATCPELPATTSALTTITPPSTINTEVSLEDSPALPSAVITVASTVAVLLVVVSIVAVLWWIRKARSSRSGWHSFQLLPHDDDEDITTSPGGGAT
jgi:Sortilin, neurotensin receptor 3, C-terminal/Sortilin, neurotensin receptor 3,